jgi:mono/diheme cytochrome c family protein
MKSKFANIGNPYQNRVSRHGKKVLLSISLLVSLITLTGCSQGSYPLDIFYEMHYQPSYKAHEPPRLSVPESAVAWFPPPPATSFANDGEHIFQVNCSMCHGPAGKGDGPVLNKMMKDYKYVPALDTDLTSPQVMGMGEDAIEAFMLGGVVVMPDFSKLLTDEEMRLVAEYVINCLQGKQPQTCP